MKIVPILKNVAKKSKFLRVFMRNGMYSLKRIRFIMNGFSVRVDDRLLVFGAYNGKSYACSPKAVYEYMIQNEKYK